MTTRYTAYIINRKPEDVLNRIKDIDEITFEKIQSKNHKKGWIIEDLSLNSEMPIKGKIEVFGIYKGESFYILLMPNSNVVGIMTNDEELRNAIIAKIERRTRNGKAKG